MSPGLDLAKNLGMLVDILAQTEKVALASYLSNVSSTHWVTSGVGPSSKVRKIVPGSRKFQFSSGKRRLMNFGGRKYMSVRG